MELRPSEKAGVWSGSTMGVENFITPANGASKDIHLVPKVDFSLKTLP